MIHDSHIPVLIHILGGALGIGSGTAAMIFRKGSRQHVLAGQVFFVSMLTMSGLGAFMAFVGTEMKLPNMGNVLGGVFTFYLVLTGWITARRHDGKITAINLAALAMIAAALAAYATSGIEALRSPDGLKDGYPAGLYFAFGSVALLAAALDVRLLVKGGVFGAQRLARHLWRMCLGMWIAVGSFFLGQPQVFPGWLKQSGLLFLPTLGVTVFMVYWLIRMLFTRAYQGRRTVIAAADKMQSQGSRNRA